MKQIDEHLLPFRLVSGLVTCALLTLVAGCGKAPGNKEAISTRDIPITQATGDATTYLTPRQIGVDFTGKPWVTHVLTSDLNEDGLLDVIACEGRDNIVVWLKQNEQHEFEEIVLASDISAPVHTEAVDIDQDGDIDLVIASMGQVFPNNDKIGSIYILENDGEEHFTLHLIIENIARVTDVGTGDFDEDGDLDLAVAQFGYDQGEVRWMRNLGDWKFESEILLGLSGAVNILVADFNGNGHLDMASIVSQQYEDLYLFENQGNAVFTKKIIFGSTNEDYGSSGISLCDLNQDGLPDILYTNGDGFDYAKPGPRPWHGVQWLENKGKGFFKYHYIGELAGAYSPSALDLDADGDLDVIAVSGFNNWDDPSAISMMWFRNEGNEVFRPQVLSHYPTHLLCTAVGDFDNDGVPSIVTGGFHAYPPYDHMSRILLWERSE